MCVRARARVHDTGNQLLAGPVRSGQGQAGHRAEGALVERPPGAAAVVAAAGPFAEPQVASGLPERFRLLF